MKKAFPESRFIRSKRAKNASGILSRIDSPWLGGVKIRVSVTCGLLGLSMLLTQNSRAALIVTATESGGNVVFSWGGGTGGAGGTSSLNLTGLTFSNSPTLAKKLNTNLVGTSQLLAGGAVDNYTLPANAATFGTNSTTFAPTITGAGGFGWGGSGLGVPSGYTSLGAISAATLTVSGQTFSTLGMANGALLNIADWGDASLDTVVQMQIGTAPIPEPATVIPLLGLALAGLGIGCRRRLSGRRKRGSGLNGAALSNRIVF